MGTTQTLTRRIAKGTFPEDQQWGFESLFDNNEVGVRYEIWDTSTLFQNAAGTTPVTAPGQPVGLVLDKSKNRVLGSELVSNGSFNTDITGWTNSAPANGTIEWSDGKLLISRVSGGLSAYQTMTGLTIGKTYKVEFNFASVVNGVVRLLPGTGTTAPGSTATSNNVGPVYFVAAATTMYLHLSLGSVNGTSGTYDNISVRELAGNHASQATDASRPTYGVVPKGGRRNLYLSSSASTSYIQLGSGTDGTLSYVSEDIPGVGICTVMQYAKLLSDGNRGPAIGITLPANRYITYSFFIRVLNGTPPAGIRNSSAVASGTGSLTSAFSGIPNGTWIRVDSSQFATTQWNTFSSTISNWWINSLTAGTTIQIGAIQCETHDIAVGQPATPYQRVGTTAFDITEQGVPTTHYLQFDGIDDWLSTSAIDFSGTDKMNVFMGVRKLSDAALQRIVELTSSSSTNNGGFSVAASGDSGGATPLRDNWITSTRGTSASGATVFSPFVAPVSNVLTSQLDNAEATIANQAKMRINGIARTAAVTSGLTSAGNYANASLFIGRRGGTSEPYNGQLYTLIARGVLSSTAEIRQAEKLIAKKTSLVTLPESFDPDALDYFSRVVAAGGSFASASYSDNYTRVAINQWFVSVKAFGLWSKIAEAYLFAGCTFPGVTVKLKHAGTATLTNSNFVSGDLVQAGPGAGLRGNAGNKRLVPGVNVTSIVNSLSVYITQADTGIGSVYYLGTSDTNDPRQGLGQLLGGTQEAYASSDSAFHYAASTVSRRNGYLVGTSRANNDRQIYRNGVSTGTSTDVATLTLGGSFGIFASGFNSLLPTNARLTFAHIGGGLATTEAANLSTATNALMTALGANVY